MSISSVPVIDQSYSMTSNQFVAITKIDSKAFVRYFRPGDQLGVVGYDTSARVAYPAGGTTLAVVDPGLTVTRAAADAIQALTFQGDSTNIGGGILKGRALLDGAAGPRALVLLSDGWHNDGTDPLTVLPSYPVHACAMGAGSQTSLLQQIAQRTGGTYYYAPRVVDMMKIYNQIRGTQPQVAVVANELQEVQPTDYMLVPATVAAGEPQAQIGVVWTDGSIQYTGGSPTSSTIAVTLVDPSGTTLSTAPQVIDQGFVVFNVPNPQPGEWQVQVEYGGGTPVGVTAGVFEFASAATLAGGGIRLEVDAPAVVRAGEPLRYTARVTDGGLPVEGLQVHATVVQPSISLAGALERHAGELGRVQPSPRDVRRGMPEDVARLMALHQARLPEEDILAHRTTRHALRAVQGARHEGAVADTRHAGNYNVQLTVSGYSPVSGTPFQRTQLFTVLAQ